jgi:hypothetical protein
MSISDMVYPPMS